ncbi:MAG TPA: 50S ribosomal protein L10 [Candidatus Paceibacterota bacterium]
MALTKQKKGEILANLEKLAKAAKTVVFVNFKGLPVGDQQALRRGLKKEAVSYTVAKKSLVRRALESLKPHGNRPELSGELALAYGEDLVAPARGIFNFHKKFPENIQILGGIFDGRYMSKTEMENIARIPDMQTLRGMFVNIINSPIQRFAIALNQIAKARS